MKLFKLPTIGVHRTAAIEALSFCLDIEDEPETLCSSLLEHLIALPPTPTHL